jgi:hypothetical protein
MTNVIFSSKVTEAMAFEIMETLGEETEIMYHENKWWIRVPYTMVGSYVGATVETANQRYLEAKYPNDIICEIMDFGTTSIWANMDNYDLMEEIWELENYPCFDDELVSIVENEAIVNYLRTDLINKLGCELLEYDGLDDVINNVIRTIFESDDIEDIIVETGMLVFIPDKDMVLEMIRNALPKEIQEWVY